MRINEVIDEDLSRRGFLGGLVGAAALGAAGSAQAKHQPAPQPTPTTPQPAPNDTKIVHLLNKPEAQALIKAGHQSGIRGVELAQFVAQCAHETANFTSMGEKGGKLDFKKYDPKVNPRKAKMLGNTQAGDGAKYHGRGYIQLTGRDNYARAGKALGLDLVNHPELVERPDVAAKVAVWYWQNHVANKVTNFSDTSAVTRHINSGLHGLEDRSQTFAGIMNIIKRA